MKDQKNQEKATAPGKMNQPEKGKEEITVSRTREEVQRNAEQERQEDAGSIPLDHDETIGIP